MQKESCSFGLQNKKQNNNKNTEKKPKNKNKDHQKYQNKIERMLCRIYSAFLLRKLLYLQC